MKTMGKTLQDIQSVIALNKEAKGKINKVLSEAEQLISHYGMDNMENRLNEEYERGMNETWEIVKKIITLTDANRYAVFRNISLLSIMGVNSPLQAKEKLLSYKGNEENDEEVYVGDIIKNIFKNKQGVVLECDTDEDDINDCYYTVFTEEDCVEIWYRNHIVKTGKNIDVHNALFT